jgi:N-formylglutamate amidohydrolase
MNADQGKWMVKERVGKAGMDKECQPTAQSITVISSLRPRLASHQPDPEFDPPFELTLPATLATPLVFNAPHSGSIYPGSLTSRSLLDATTLRRSEDAHVHRLFAGIVALGAPLLAARFPRAFLDVNREPLELDPRLIEGRLPPEANIRSMRVAGGLGTVPRIVADGHEIYRRRLPLAEALRRIDTLYRPYHAALRSLLDRSFARFGQVALIDCHSMPSSSLPQDSGGGLDVVLGDRYGTSCSGTLTAAIEDSFRSRGYAVGRNRPYAGGFITEHYGQPVVGRHAVQVEINRAIYMDERTLAPKPGFDRIASDLIDVFAEVARSLDIDQRPMAAE